MNNKQIIKGIIKEYSETFTALKADYDKDFLAWRQSGLIHYTQEEVRKAKADWLRNEIEKLEKEKFPEKNGGSAEMPYTEMLTADPTTGEVFQQFFYNQALTSIITRYKDELKVLESK